MGDLNLVISIESGLLTGGVVRGGEVLISSAAPLEEERTAEGEGVSSVGEGGNLDINSFERALQVLLGDLRGGGYSAFNKIAIGLPLSFVHLRTLELPFTDIKKVHEVMALEIGEVFTVPLSELVLGAKIIGSSGGGSGGSSGGGEGASKRTLVAAADKERLRAIIEAMGRAGIEPQWAGVTPLVLSNLIKGDTAEGGGVSSAEASGALCALVGGGYISVTDPETGDDILYGVFNKDEEGERNIKTLLASLAADGLGVDRFISTPECGEYLGGIIDRAVETLSVSDRDASLKGLGLEIEKRFRSTVNLRRGDLAYAKSFEGFKRASILTATLLSVFVLLWGVYMATSYSSLKGTLTVLEGRLKDGYEEVFPGERGVRAPLYQLESRLANLEKTGGALGGSADVLRVMKELTTSVKSLNGAGISIYQLDIEGGRFTAKGEGESFNNASDLKGALAGNPSFSMVAISDVKKKGAKGVTFSIAGRVEGRSLSLFRP